MVGCQFNDVFRASGDSEVSHAWAVVYVESRSRSRNKCGNFTSRSLREPVYAGTYKGMPYAVFRKFRLFGGPYSEDCSILWVSFGMRDAAIAPLQVACSSGKGFLPTYV